MRPTLSPGNAVINYQQEIDKALKSLQALSAEHFNLKPEHLDWKAVEYVEHLAELITRARDFAFQEYVYLHKGETNETLN